MRLREADDGEHLKHTGSSTTKYVRPLNVEMDTFKHPTASRN